MRRATKTVSYRPRRPSSRRKKRKKIKLKLVVFVLALILLLALAFTAIKALFFKDSLLTLNQTTWGSELTVDSAFIFNTSLITTPKDGIVHLAIEQNQEVKSGQVVANVVNKEKEAELKQKIDELKEKLKKYDATQFTTTTEVADVETMHNTIRSLINSYRYYRTHKSTAGMNKTMQELNKVMNNFYQDKVQNDNDKQTYLKLKEELNIAQTDYDHVKQEILASSTGVVSYELDNIEEQMNMSNFPFSDYKWFLQKLSFSTVNDGDTVVSEQKIAKVVSTDKYWVVARVPLSESESFVKASKVTVTLNEEAREVDYLNHVTDKKYTYFYYQVNSKPEVTTRFNKLKLATEKLEGMEIPAKALEKIEDKAFVYQKNGKVYEKIEVEIIKEYADKILIKSLDNGIKILADTADVRR